MSTVLENPVTLYPSADESWKQEQQFPGLDANLTPKADHGEESYVGSGKLKGRKALITGADSGIGRAVAIAFAREGADILLSYLPEEQQDADEVIQYIEREGRKAVAKPGDLMDEAYCTELIRTANDQLGGLDILVNVAGYQQASDSIADITTEQFDRTMKTNVYALFWLTKAALEVMQAGSTIINTSSTQAYSPTPVLVDYATSKWAINGFSKALAQQIAEKGIRLNVVAPGPVWTPLQVQGGQPTDALAEFGDQTPLGRAGQPVEMAPAYVFLASPESSYVVGETLSANGGMPTP